MSYGSGGYQQEKQKKAVDAGTSGEEGITCGGCGMAKSMVLDDDHPHVHMDLQALPEGCIANVVSLTTPPDACRFSAVSRSFMSAAKSDAVWDKFLPHDIPSILPHFSSKKELYLTLCENPVLLDDGKMMFFLDKWSGKKCYMISARDLMIAWGGNPDYWGWNSVGDSRFEEVAELRFVWWLEIRGKIETRILSPSTVYQAYLVFKLSAMADGFDHDDPLDVKVGLLGEEEAGNKRTVFLDQEEVERRRQKTPVGTSETQYPKKRTDGWLEVEMGEFFCPGEEDGAIIEMTCMEVKRIKRGLIVQGIEVRPKRM
ncbi:F-box protein PP2-B10-like [Pyrus x bretschneideri]|uniref:F-box protein PP2-B10-like n=1 Tax=Pyrus x bretschneideri TaxID=225117 RepID=UPI002030B7A5|nr:F-box protein PP2-B10-like [Pyrus x bretschneideri]